MPPHAIHAEMLFRRGEEAYEAARFQEAIDRWMQTRTVYLGLGLKIEAAHCDGNIGNALSALGQAGRAIEHYERAQAVYVRVGS